jgi:hypothetical protein
MAGPFRLARSNVPGGCKRASQAARHSDSVSQAKAMARNTSVTRTF